MKNWILRASAVTLALAAGAAIGCSGDGCGGTNVNANDNSSSTPVSMQCGQGTYLNSAHQCVPLQNSNASPQSAPVHYLSN